MKNNRAKIILILVFIIGSVWALYPTYEASQYRSTLSAFGQDSAKKANWLQENNESFKDANAKSIKLGLDLRGGIYVTMEVDVLKFIEEQATTKDDIFNQVLAATHQAELTTDEPVVPIFVKKFGEIAAPKGKALANYFYFSDAPTGEDALIQKSLQKGVDEAVDRAIEIIRNRIDQFGLTEPTIQKQGQRRVIIELPGAGDPAQVHQLLEGTAQLEFRTFKNPDIVRRVIERIDKQLVSDPRTSLNAPAGADVAASAAVDSAAKQTTTISAKTDSASKPAANTSTAAKATTDSAKPATAMNAADSVAQADSLAYAGLTDAQRAEKLKKEKPFTFLLIQGATQQGQYFASEEVRTQMLSILGREDIKPIYSGEMAFMFSKPIREAQGTFYQVYFLNPTPEMTGQVVTDARARASGGGATVGPEVSMQMDEEGARVWKRVTRANLGKQVAIVLDNVVYSAPVVNSEIPNGNSSITGIKDMAEANMLSIVLKAGALPAPVKIIQEQVVGPSLGADSISKGTWSIIMGFAAVILFMAMYYMTGGIVADIAVLINLLFTMAILATFGATLTLPGMAGLVLTVGIAVDANVLIYERIREELEAGKSLRLALDDGYSRAFAPIFDGHLTALFSGIILYSFGTGTVQGFAVTLMIGIVASLFTAIVITRVVFDLLLERKPELVKFG